MPSPKRPKVPEEIRLRARQLRKHMTPAEKTLWQQLRARRLQGLKFRRQHPLGPFIADFYCAAHHLVIEVDGDIHDLQVEEDAARTHLLEDYGYRVIRFRNEEIEKNLDVVLSKIMSACKQ
jgi:very-short-patch-repair endonuclease